MIIANYIAYILTIIGGLNWGLVGIFNFDLVNWICVGRNAGSIIIYILIMLAAIWLIISPIISRGMLDLGCKYKKEHDEEKKTGIILFIFLYKAKSFIIKTNKVIKIIDKLIFS